MSHEKKTNLKRNSLPYVIPAHSFTYSPKKGFTLIELAIILVVIGILIALGAGLVGILTKQAKLPFKTHTSQVQEKL